MTWEDEGRMTWEEIMGRRVGRVVEGLWEGRTQREKLRKERGDLSTPARTALYCQYTNSTGTF